MYMSSAIELCMSHLWGGNENGLQIEAFTVSLGLSPESDTPGQNPSTSTNEILQVEIDI